MNRLGHPIRSWSPRWPARPSGAGHSGDQSAPSTSPSPNSRSLRRSRGRAHNLREGKRSGRSVPTGGRRLLSLEW